MSGGPDKQPAALRLELSDRNSPTWAKLRRHLEARREALRRKNDNPNLDPVQTALLRGAVREISNLLALGSNPDPTMVADEEHGS